MSGGPENWRDSGEVNGGRLFSKGPGNFLWISGTLAAALISISAGIAALG